MSTINGVMSVLSSFVLVGYFLSKKGLSWIHLYFPYVTVYTEFRWMKLNILTRIFIFHQCIQNFWFFCWRDREWANNCQTIQSEGCITNLTRVALSGIWRDPGDTNPRAAERLLKDDWIHIFGCSYLAAKHRMIKHFIFLEWTVKPKPQLYVHKARISS